MEEKEYVEKLKFCMRNNLICFEFYRRNKDWKRKIKEYLQQETEIRVMACVPLFDTMHPNVSLGAFFNDRNFRHLSEKYPQVYGNIATPKLIQCGTAEMPENKAFHGFCGFVFSFFEPVSV